MDHNEKFTRRDSNADTADLPDISAETAVTEERRIRAVSYRERQRQESARRESEARARGEEIEQNPYINSHTYDDFADDFSTDRSVVADASDFAKFSEMEKLRAVAEARANGVKPEPKKRKKKQKAKHSVAYRVVCGILGSLIGIMVIAIGVGAYYIHSLGWDTVDLTPNNTQNSQYTQYYEDEDGVEEIRVMDIIHEGSETDSFSRSMKDWKSAGNAYLKSNKVINILLVGIDRNDDGSDGRSDTMILASLNMKNKTITLSSFYRDCWMYQTFDNGERSAWAKLNATFVYGGPNGLIENLEDYYKIDIDHYVGVDFQSFLDIIDVLGGITVPVQAHEAAYINEQLCRNTVQSGDAVHLQGDEALWFVRMRHSDADEEISRTRRQRIFISALINEFKSISLTEINSVVNTFFKYVQTDMSMTEIAQYGTRALLGKWYNYEIKQQQVPEEAYRMEHLGSTWVWLVDYPGAAYEMQNNIYGYSNIVLNESRYSMLDIAKYLIRSGYEIV